MAKNHSIKISNKKQIELDIICKSLVGKEVLIVDSKNKNQVGMRGVLVFESANLFYLKIENSVKKLLKTGLIFEFELDGKQVRVNAELLGNSLVSRIKKIK